MTIREQVGSFYEGAIPELVQAASEDSKISRGLAGYSCPFVPYVGEAYETEAVRLLVVGKAPCGWGSPDCANLRDFFSYCVLSGGVPTNFWRWSHEFVIKRVQPYYGGREGEDPYHSLFWHRIFLLGSAILEGSNKLNDEKSERRAERCFRGVAWTNVFKIGTVGGNPKAPMERLLCKEPFNRLLLKDLEILKPTVVLFSTHRNYDDYLRTMLPGLSIETIRSKDRSEADTARVTLPGPGFLGFRTSHFQNRKFKPGDLLDCIISASDR